MNEPEYLIVPIGDLVSGLMEVCHEVGFLAFNLKDLVRACCWAWGDHDRVETVTDDFSSLAASEGEACGHALHMLCPALAIFAEYVSERVAIQGALTVDEDGNPPYVFVEMDFRYCVVLKRWNKHEESNSALPGGRTLDPYTPG